MRRWLAKVGDFDAITIRSTPQALLPILQPQVSLAITWRTVKDSGHRLLACTSPLFVWVDLSLKGSIIEALKSGPLNRVVLPHDSPTCFLKNSATISTEGFLQALSDAGVTSIVAHGFGQKSGLYWGYNMVQKVRAIHPFAEIECDIGLNIRPAECHWISKRT